MTDATRGDDSSPATPGDPGNDLPRATLPGAASGPAGPAPWWAPPVRFLRWLLGAGTLVGGLTWILLNLSGPTALLDTVVGCVLAAGGLVLLMPHRIRLPRTAAAITMTITALGGTTAGSFATTARWGSYAYIVDHGWPFHWLQRGAAADDADTAYRLAQTADWHVDLVALAANLLVFAYAGMLVVVVAVLIRSARRS